jgi:hypothetical protein
MPNPVPSWLESPAIEYSELQVTLETQRADAQGQIGYVLCTAKHPCFDTTRLSYDIYAVNYGYEDSDTSTFKRQILLGRPFDAKTLTGYAETHMCMNRAHMHSFGPFQNAQFSPPRTLWCMNCWKDDMYHSGSGGVPIPFWLMGRYFTCDGLFAILNSCTSCLKHFQLEGENSVDHTTLFVSVLNTKLQTAVEDQLLRKGIHTSTFFERNVTDTLDEEVRDELIATVLHPERVERLAGKAGLDTWDWVDAMG